MRIFFVLGSLAISSSQAASSLNLPIHDHGLFSDSGVTYKSYSDIEGALEKLAQDNPRLVQHVQYGKSAGGRTLDLVRIGNTEASASQLPRYAAEISGAIHGNEYLGIELELLQNLVEQRDRLPGVKALLDGGGAIYGIPVLNPDGYTLRQRENAAGTDLNRDFDQLPTNDRAFTQPETRDLADYLDNDLRKNSLKLQYSLDYHCCGPSMIVPWSYQDRLPDGNDLLVFQAIGELGKSLLGFDWGNPSSSVGYTAQNSSVDYFYAKYGTFATAIEGRYKGETPFLSQHLELIDRSIARAMAAASPKP